MLPRIRITDLMAEVAGWTLFPDCFTHLRTGEAAADIRILLAGLLADGLNLGLTRMAEACSVASLAQLAWQTAASSACVQYQKADCPLSTSRYLDWAYVS